jgi:hypothetical protein
MKEVNDRESKTKVCFSGRYKEHRSMELLILRKKTWAKSSEIFDLYDWFVYNFHSQSQPQELLLLEYHNYR